MVSKSQLEARDRRKEAREELRGDYMSLQEIADELGMWYTRVYALVIKEGRIPAIRYSDGGQNSPKWLVRREDFEAFQNTPRITGRPRVGDRKVARTRAAPVSNRG